MKSSKRQARKFLEGAVSAYDDCANISEKIAKSQPGFVQFAVMSGSNPQHAEIVAMASETLARGMATSMREKANLLRAELANAPSETSGRARGGFVRAEKLSPQRRSEIAKLAAEKRWKGNVQ